jgi:hypothetical protein
MKRCLFQGRFDLLRIIPSSSLSPRPSTPRYYFSAASPRLYDWRQHDRLLLWNDDSNRRSNNDQQQRSLKHILQGRRFLSSAATDADAAEITTSNSTDSTSTPNTTTTKTVDSLSIIPPDDSNDDGGVVLDIVTIIQQKLKESSVEIAAEIFFDHYYNINSSNNNNNNKSKNKNSNYDPHLGLIDILDNLDENPQQSEAFLKAIQELANNNTNSKDASTTTTTTFRPTIDHYRIVLDEWYNFKLPSAKRNQALLDYMEQYADINYEIETCNLVLKTWAKKGNAERAQDVLDTMIKKKVHVDVISYSHVLLAWSKSKSPLAAKRADDILQRMETYTNFEPNSECILHVTECWSKSKRLGAEFRIEELFTILKQQLTHEINNKNDKTSKTSSSSSLLLDHNNNNDCDIKNLQQIFWSVLQAYQNVENAHRAEELLLDFVDDYENKNKMFPPTTGMYLSVLNSWNKSASTNRATRSEKLLQMMEINNTNNVLLFPQPNIECYTAVLNCMASSKKPDAAKRAETLLRRMDLQEETKPNLISLTCVLIAWARSDDLNAPIEAERIYEEIQDRGLKPDRFVFAGLITAWGRNNSEREDPMIKVENYFQRIKDIEQEQSSILLPSENNGEKVSSSFKTTVVEYTVVIQAYANYVSRNIDKSRESVARVESLLDEMLKSEDKNLKPNILTYAAVLKCIAAARRVPDRGDRADIVLQKMYSEQVEITPYIINLVKRCKNIRKKSTHK